MKVRIKRLSPDAVIPAKAHPTDAGFDLYASRVEARGSDQLVYHSDVAFEIPEGYVGLVFCRSSVCRTSLTLTNCVGVIDSGYRGEVTCVFRQHGHEHPYVIGERFAQLVIMPYPEIEFEETEELAASDRGEGGYGSSGR